MNKSCDSCLGKGFCPKWDNYNDRPYYCDGKKFKDKSRFIELPCKVGDTVYTNCEIFNKAIGYTVEDIHIDKKEIRFFTTTYNCYTDEFLDDKEFVIDDIGRTVFLTKEEAEAKLKEM